jgi:radical SAM superfamily enzyme YgiQ (UPF0313 family)
MKSILLSTIQKPLGISNETCTENIQSEMYHAQVTLAQDVFSLRAQCTGWGNEFIAANLKSPVTVMHYPTEKQFVREIKKIYDYVGISFVMCTFPKTIRLCKLIREHAPESKIILGGYGTILEECDQYADYVCREEGVNYLKRLLHEEEISDFKMPRIVRKISVMSVTTRSEAIIPVGLGCSRGCDFCCTSHFFNKKYFPLLKTGKELNEAMISIDSGNSTIRNFGIVDEDFLAPKKRSLEMAELNAKEVEKPILFSCLTSLKSLSQYTIEQLLSMGLFGAWAGVESKNAPYPKLKDIHPPVMFKTLQEAGITMLASIIIGYDWHNDQTLEDDFQYLLSLNPTLSQIMIYSPCPQTPLYQRYQSENRLLEIPYIKRDGFHVMFKHPHFSRERLEKLLLELFAREYEELGPSIFRIQQVQLMGYNYLKKTDKPLFLARRNENKKLCLDIYPLLKTGIRTAPSERVRKQLTDLKEKVEDTFKITGAMKIKEQIAPLLYFYAKMKKDLLLETSVKTEVNFYNT